MTLRELLNQGYQISEQHPNIEKTDIKLLILGLLELDNSSLLQKRDEEVSKNDADKIFKAFNRLIKGEAVQYILGYTYFYGYKIFVNKNVLIPRFETEELVEHILKYYHLYFGGNLVNVLDIGTGSGNISIALKKEAPNMLLTATDISKEAIATAKFNAEENNCEITFLEGDMLEPIIKQNTIKYDILVSNPPYIKTNDYVDNKVLNNEPHLALFGGSDGMKYYKKIFKDAKKVLKDKAFMAFEHGHNEKDEMIELAKTYFPKAQTKSIKDLNGQDRITILIIGEMEV